MILNNALMKNRIIQSEQPGFSSRLNVEENQEGPEGHFWFLEGSRKVRVWALGSGRRVQEPLHVEWGTGEGL